MLDPLNEVPFHHFEVVVSSTATATLERVAPPLAAAVPVMVPLQLVP